MVESIRPREAVLCANARLDGKGTLVTSDIKYSFIIPKFYAVSVRHIFFRMVYIMPVSLLCAFFPNV